MRRIFKKIATDVGSLALAGLAVVGTGGTALPSDKPHPTFLESGDNDLIRFQMGGAPTQETLAQFLDAPLRVSEPMPAARKTRMSSSESNGLQRLPERRTAVSAARQEARMKEQATPGRIAAQGAAPTTASPKAAPEPLPKPDAVADEAHQAEDIQGLGLFAQSAPQVSDLAADTALESETIDVAPARPASPSQTPAPQPEISEEISSRLVAVCLNNPEDAAGPKAFDIRRNGPPRFVADIGATACARFEPTRHTLFLWKTNDIGALSLILSNRLDLNDADGTQVTLDWIRDR